MATLKSLPRGAQIVLVSGPLLLVSLFFTWQDVSIDYGSSGVATQHLDGFDTWGLLLAILTVATVTLVVVVHTSEDELAASRSHATALLALGVSVAGVAVFKSFTDAGSTVQSYLFVGFAIALAIGTALDWASTRQVGGRAVGHGRRRVSSAV